MGRDVLFFNHTHTPDSNRFEDEIRDLQINTHATDYVELTRVLPEGQDAIFVKTDHWKTDPSYFERIQSEVEASGGSFERFDTYICLKLENSTGVVINGVESSLLDDKYHVTICGLPLSDKSLYRTLELRELIDIGTRAEWIAPAHIGMPFHKFPEAYLNDLFERAEKKRATVALGYSTGYFPMYNRISRNEIPSRKSVIDYANQYQVPLTPELDLHGAVPRGFSGCGVVDSSVMVDINGGTLPTKTILNANLLRPPGFQPGLTLFQFLQDYAAFLPLFTEPKEPNRRFRNSLPDTEWLRSLNIRRHSVPLK